MSKVAPKAHFEKVKVNNGADMYCLKEDTRVEGPWEFGHRPLKRNCKVDWDDTLKKAKAGDFDGIDP